MKHLLLLFACLLLFSCTHEKKKVKNDLVTMNLKGEVKSITSYSYKAIENSGKVEKDSLKGAGVEIYNSSGFLVLDSSIMKNRNGFKLIQIFDEHNNRLERKLYKYGKLKAKTIKKYDEKNNVIEENTLASPSDKLYPDSLAKTGNTYSYKYDTINEILEAVATQDGKPWYRAEYEYDTKGNLIKRKMYYAWDKGLSDFFRVKYDDKGNQLEKDDFNADSILVFRFIDKYDDKGNLIQEIARRKGDTLEFDEVKTYDDKGNLIRNIDYHKDSVVHWDWRYEYRKFDATGNWTEQVFYNKGKPETITERTIEYY
jgi:hypothetical protein